MRNAGRTAAVVVSAFAWAGCATGPQSSLSARFVKPGAPTVDLGGPQVASPPATTVPPGPLAPAARPPRDAETSGVTIETADPGLANALLLEKMLPTAQNHMRVAEEYQRLGVVDVAYARVSLALEAEPQLAGAHEMLARIWRDWGFPERGVGAAHRATYYEPGSASAWNTLGTLFDRLGQVENARTAFDRALELDPSASWALNNLCHLEFSLGRIEAARERCESALAIEPGLAAAHNNLGLTLAASGDMERAYQQFRAGGGAAAASYNLGIVCLAHQDYATAADYFEDALEARPGFTAAKERAHSARVRALTGR